MAGRSSEKIQSALNWLRNRSLGSAAVALVVTLAFLLGFAFRGPGSGHGQESTTQPQVGATATQYTCSMHPEVRMPNRDDKCPICNMELIPVTGSSDAGASGLKPSEIKLSPEAVALIDVQTTPVTRQRIDRHVDMVGTVEYDETRLAYITAYMAGRLDRMYVDYIGIPVRLGDHLAEIYSPELLVAKQELMLARQSVDQLDQSAGTVSRSSTLAILESARDRLRLLGLKDDQIKSMEAGEVPGDHITLYAPTGGIVIEKHAKPGSYVNEGDPIYTIADLSRVWVMLEAYESDLPWLRYGQPVTFTVQGLGDERFEGQIVFIDPMLDPRKRTARVRVNVDNTDGVLKPGMFVRADVRSTLAEAGRIVAPDLAGKWVSPMHPEVIRDEPGPCPVCGMDLVRAEDLGYLVGTDQSQAPLVVPDSAVLQTGRRGVVYVQTQVNDSPGFEGRIVELGPSGDGFVIIRAGLEEGEQVVTRGSFQIDSALQIQAKQSMMNPGDSEPAPPKSHIHGPEADALKAVYTAYFGLSKSLTDDNLVAAKSHAKEVNTAITWIIDARTPEALADQWRDQELNLVAVTAAITYASDIESARASFETLSSNLIALLETSHVENLGGVYLAHCPMAFDFKGASWLTTEPTIANPYFGDRMLRCGTIEQTLSEPAESPEPGSTKTPNPGNHNHE